MDSNKHPDDLTAHQTDGPGTTVTDMERNALDAETLTTDIEARQPVPVVSGASSTAPVQGEAGVDTDTVMGQGSNTEIAPPGTSLPDTAVTAPTAGAEMRALLLPDTSHELGSHPVRLDIRRRLTKPIQGSTAKEATVEMNQDKGDVLDAQHIDGEATARSDASTSPAEEHGSPAGGVALGRMSNADLGKAASEAGTELTMRAKSDFDAESDVPTTHDTVTEWRARVENSKDPLKHSTDSHAAEFYIAPPSSSGSVTSSGNDDIDNNSNNNIRKSPARPLKPADPTLLSRATSSILSALGSLVPSSASMWHGAGWALGKLGDGAGWAGDKLGDGARRWCWSQEDYDFFKGNKQWDVTSGKGSAPVSLTLTGREFTIAGSTVGLGGSKGALGLYKGVKGLVDGIEEKQKQKSAGRGARGGEDEAGTARSVVAGVA